MVKQKFGFGGHQEEGKRSAVPLAPKPVAEQVHDADGFSKTDAIPRGEGGLGLSLEGVNRHPREKTN